jgi:hypothetical protein
MAMVKRTWTAPQVYNLEGPDAVSLRTVFESLTEYLRGHIGVWGTAEGATDANGRFTVVHNAGFIPTSILVTEEYVDSAAHDMGPFHLHDDVGITETSFEVHFLTKSGQDRGTHNVKVNYLVLPPTRIRN